MCNKQYQKVHRSQEIIINKNKDRNMHDRAACGATLYFKIQIKNYKNFEH